MFPDLSVWRRHNLLMAGELRWWRPQLVLSYIHTLILVGSEEIIIFVFLVFGFPPATARQGEAVRAERTGSLVASLSLLASLARHPGDPEVSLLSLLSPGSHLAHVASLSLLAGGSGQTERSLGPGESQLPLRSLESHGTW